VSTEQLIRYYAAGPTIARFHASNAAVRCIRGPVGSGKTTACVFELIRRAREQAPGPDGIRRTRGAVVRNTAPQLETTTLKTFQDALPSTHCKISMDAPITVRIQFADVDCEMIFLALDNEQDVRKLLSLELTFVFVNEGREIPLPVLDQLTARAGRYPGARLGGCTWSGIVMDSNAPDVESWWYRFAEVEHPPGWEFFAQPGGLSPDAENLANLNQNAETLKLPANHPQRLKQGRAYYERISAGKSADWIRVYVNGDYGFSQDGRPVFSEYSDSVHCYSGPLEASPRDLLTVGVDFGLGGSAAAFCQREGDRWLIVHEMIVSDMGVESFGRVLGMELAERFPGCEVRVWTDPAGVQRSQVDERTPLGILKQLGLPARACPSQDLLLRLEAIRRPLTRLTDGKPAFQVFERCTKLRKALSGGYHYRRIYVGGGERFHDLPEKDEHSHIVDALGYALLGGGEGKPRPKPGYRQWPYGIGSPYASENW
jgi:hypothetical protein